MWKRNWITCHRKKLQLWQKEILYGHNMHSNREIHENSANSISVISFNQRSSASKYRWTWIWRTTVQQTFVSDEHYAWSQSHAYQVCVICIWRIFAYDGPIFLVPLRTSYPSLPVLHSYPILFIPGIQVFCISTTDTHNDDGTLSLPKWPLVTIWYYWWNLTHKWKVLYFIFACSFEVCSRGINEMSH